MLGGAFVLGVEAGERCWGCSLFKLGAAAVLLHPLCQPAQRVPRGWVFVSAQVWEPGAPNTGSGTYWASPSPALCLSFPLCETGVMTPITWGSHVLSIMWVAQLHRPSGQKPGSQDTWVLCLALTCCWGRGPRGL